MTMLFMTKMLLLMLLISFFTEVGPNLASRIHNPEGVSFKVFCQI